MPIMRMHIIMHSMRRPIIMHYYHAYYDAYYDNMPIMHTMSIIWLLCLSWEYAHYNNAYYYAYYENAYCYAYYYVYNYAYYYAYDYAYY